MLLAEAMIARLLVVGLLIVEVRVEARNASCISLTSDGKCVKATDLLHLNGTQSLHVVRTKRQAGGRTSSLGGCENAQLSQIMRHVMSPLISRSRKMKLGDIAQIVQRSVQQATGQSHEIIMGKGEMMIASQQASAANSCRLRIGEFYTQVYETPVQYDINNEDQEKILSNIDFGEPLGGSGYPGQQPFPRSAGAPNAGGSSGSDGSDGDSSGPSHREGVQASLGGCSNSQLSDMMTRVAGPLLSRAGGAGGMKLGDIAKIVQQRVQRLTGKSYEVMMSKGDMAISSQMMSDSSSCRQRIDDYYTTIYETPVQYDINDVAAEQLMSNIDFGEPLGGSGYPGQAPWPHAPPSPSAADVGGELATNQVSPSSSSSSAASRGQQWQASAGGCGSAMLSSIMNDVVPPLLQNNNMRIGDVARALQQAVQQRTGQSYEVLMGKGDMVINSQAMTGASSCREQIGEYYTTVYKTPVQYDISNVFEENFMANIDYGQPLGSSQPPFLQQPALLQPPPLQQPYYYPPAPIVPPVVPLECFSADAVIQTSEGPKRMDALKTGDEVLSIDQTMILFSPIIMFLHRDEEVMAEFNVIRTRRGDRIKLTNEHLIYVSDCQPTSSFKLIRAKKVTTAHCLMVTRGPVRMLTTDRVVNVTKTVERGIYAPLTKTGDIIVNDILSSCHSNIAVKTLQDSFFSIYRTLLSFLLPEKSSELPYGVEFFNSAVDLFVPSKMTF